jgi:hypothetical protein
VWRGVVVVIGLWLALMTTACAEDDAIAIRDWTAIEPDGSTHPVALPARLTPGTTLERTVIVPPGWDARPLTLTILSTTAAIALRADGTEIAETPVARDDTSLYRGQHRWVISVAHQRPDVRLSMRCESAGAPVFLRDPPRLSDTATGDARWLRLTSVDHSLSVVSTGVAFLLAVLYAGQYLFDRRRRAEGWFALQAFTAFLYIVALMYSRADRHSVAPLFTLISVIANVTLLSGNHFIRAYFATSRPHRAFDVLTVAAAASAIVVYITRADHLVVLQLVLSQLVMCGLIHALLTVRGTREVVTDARLVAAAWIGCALAGAVEGTAARTAIDLTPGIHVFIPTVTLFGCLQGLVLARAHVRSLRAAESLNEELRLQIADRSRQLSAVLARVTDIPEAPANLAEGTVIDERYRVVRALGAGGMGTVYEAVRLRDDRVVALKLLKHASTPQALARFAREAQAAALVRHRNIVEVLDVGVSDTAGFYIVMERVEGASVEDHRERFGQPSWAKKILAQTADALCALHGAGIVHRDIKPANVLIDRDGTAKLADFGIAALNSEVDEMGATQAADGKLTKPGAWLGTPLYMAPELVHGAANVKPSADVFSFGVMAFEMLTGHPAFATPPCFDALAGRVTAPAKANVDDILLRAIDFDPSRRPSIRELADALEP